MLLKPFMAYLIEDKDKADRREIAVIAFYFNRNSRWYKVIDKEGKLKSIKERDLEAQYRSYKWI